jgi:NTE family protein
MSEIGLVLGGGGAKGAYEIGAWRAICEAGYDKYISIYSGSSIGAINCALVQLMSWQELTDLWLNYNLNRVYLADSVDLEDIMRALRMIRRGEKIEFNGLVSRTGLVELLDDLGIDRLEKIFLDCYATVTNITEIPEEKRYYKAAIDWYNGKKIGMTQYVHLKDAQKDFIVDMLLASSAIPLIFPPLEVGGQFFVDGGINDNLPIAPLYRRGIKKIIAISCEHVNYHNLKRRFPSCEIMLLQPSKYLGNLIDGTINFKRKKLRKSYSLGYNDSVKTIRMIMNNNK